MDKFAQKRSRRSRLLETVNLPGKALEGLHSEFADAMEEVREVDQKIREAAEDVKPAIRNARSALRRRDYLNAAYNVAGFHERCKHVKHILAKFLQTGSVQHFDYLLDNFENKEDLFKYDPKAEVALATAQFEELTKESGIKDKLLNIYDYVGDTAHNIGTSKGLSKRLMESRFNTEFVKILKDETTKIVGKSNRMLSDLLDLFNDMESGVSRRNPRLYIAKAKKFIQKFDAYHKEYLIFDEKVIQPLRTHQAAIAEKANKEKAEKEAIELQKQRAIQEAEVARRQEAERTEMARQQAIEQARRKQEEAEAEEAKKFLAQHPDVPIPEYEELSFEEYSNKKRQEAEELRKAKEKALYRLQQQDDEVDQPWEDEEDVDLSSLMPKAPFNLKVTPEKQDAVIPDANNLPAGNLKAKFKPKLKQHQQQQQSLAHHDNFMKQLEVHAAEDNVGEFIRGLLDYSEQLESTDSQASANLLIIAQNVLEDYKKAGIFDKLDKILNKKDKNPAAPNKNPIPLKQEFQRVNESLREKPQELIDDERNRYKIKKIDLPDGSIDKAYSDIPFLANITPDEIIVSQAAASHIKSLIIGRIVNVLKLEDFYDPSIEMDKKIVPAIKNAIYNGWVISAASVQDSFNPRDKYIEIFSRLNLSELDSQLSGIAKLYIVARVSADRGVLNVRTVKKHFAITNLKETPKPKLNPNPTPTSIAAPPSPEPKSVIDEPAPATRRSPDDDAADEEDFDQPDIFDLNQYDE